MKKIIKISCILITLLLIMGSTVFAALDCALNMQATKTEVTKNEEVTININLSNIQSEKGVIALGARLEYDKNSLELVKMEGKNSWSTPSYNEATGKLVTDRNGVTKKDETVFQITFKVKTEKRQTLSISLKDITVADGTLPIKKIEKISKDITIKEINPNPEPSPNPDVKPDPDVKPNPDVKPDIGHDNEPNIKPSQGVNQNIDISANNINSNKTNTQNSISNKKLPKAGITNIFLIILIIVIVLIVIFYIRLKTLDKKVKR